MTKSTVPVIFWVISAIALLWNLMGVASFAGDLMMTPELLDLMEEKTPGIKDMYQNNPTWMKVVYGVATIAGLLGAISLIIRKKFAFILFVISLIAVLIQMGYSIFGTDSIEVLGVNGALLMPVFVICISAFLVYYSRKASALNWIT